MTESVYLKEPQTKNLVGSEELECKITIARYRMALQAIYVAASEYNPNISSIRDFCKIALKQDNSNENN